LKSSFGKSKRSDVLEYFCFLLLGGVVITAPFTAGLLFFKEGYLVASLSFYGLGVLSLIYLLHGVWRHASRH